MKYWVHSSRFAVREVRQGDGTGDQPAAHLAAGLCTIGIDDPAVTGPYVEMDGVVPYQADEGAPVCLEPADAKAG